MLIKNRLTSSRLFVFVFVEICVVHLLKVGVASVGGWICVLRDHLFQQMRGFVCVCVCGVVWCVCERERGCV